jgi:epoxyqueuosine reductase QueG
MRRIVAVFALGAAAVGCSTVDPSPKLKAATSAIDAAKAAGAANFPASSELIAKAEKYLGTAQSLIKDGNYDQGFRQLAMASSAADDAKVTATEASNQAKVKQLDAQIAELKTKLGM